MDNNELICNIDSDYKDGIVQQAKPAEWTSTETTIKVSLFCHASLCDKQDESRPCRVGWCKKNIISTKLFRAINTAELDERCIDLNSKRDLAFSYRVDYSLDILFVRPHDQSTHFRANCVVCSYELGHSGITSAAVLNIINKHACTELGTKYDIRIHHVFSIEISVTKSNNLTVGGCPEIVNKYKASCHPSICVCNNERQPGNLCHHWYVDTILGGNMDVKTAHPCVTPLLQNGRIKEFRPLYSTLVRVTDDVVWGGLLGKLGLGLQLIHNPSQDAAAGFTTLRDHRILMTINTACCKILQLFGDTVLHECAHVRVLADSPSTLYDKEGHGQSWLQRMRDVRKLLAYRLSEDDIAPPLRLIRGHITCKNCSYSKDSSLGKYLTRCPDCFSENIDVTVYKTIEAKDINQS